MDNLKSNASSLGRQKEEWMERRTLKRDKGGNLELQLQLNNEMAEKARTQEQLMHVSSQLADMEAYVTIVYVFFHNRDAFENVASNTGRRTTKLLSPFPQCACTSEVYGVCVCLSV